MVDLGVALATIIVAKATPAQIVGWSKAPPLPDQLFFYGLNDMLNKIKDQSFNEGLLALASALSLIVRTLRCHATHWK